VLRVICSAALRVAEHFPGGIELAHSRLALCTRVVRVADRCQRAVRDPDRGAVGGRIHLEHAVEICDHA
jgi:hypothetical protein